MFALRIYQIVTYLVWPFWVLVRLCSFFGGSKKESRIYLWERLGLPTFLASTPEGVPCYWFHAVSLGETQAVFPLIDKFLAEEPSPRILFSHITGTALELAKNYFQNRVEHLLLGPDLLFRARYRMRQARPSLLVFVESDIWPSLAKEARDRGGKVAVVNARLSSRSAQRFARGGFFTKALWELLDLCLVQSLFQKKLWLQAGFPQEKIELGGFLKLDRPEVFLDRSLRLELTRIWPGLAENAYFSTISCTHEGEEEPLVEAFASLAQQTGSSFCLLLAPRHPARFDRVWSLLKGQNRLRFSQKDRTPARGDLANGVYIVLIDGIGFLPYCYASSDFCLVGGSWVEGVGGHNILEPVVVASLPTFSGPHLETQRDLWEIAKSYQLVVQTSLEDLVQSLASSLERSVRQEWILRCEKYKSENRGTVERCYRYLQKLSS